jgi:hypothetical protein
VADAEQMQAGGKQALKRSGNVSTAALQPLSATRKLRTGPDQLIMDKIYHKMAKKEPRRQ